MSKLSSHRSLLDTLEMILSALEMSLQLNLDFTLRPGVADLAWSVDALRQSTRMLLMDEESSAVDQAKRAEKARCQQQPPK